MSQMKNLRWAIGLVIGFLFSPFVHAQLMLHGDGGHGNGCLINSGAFPVGFTAYQVTATQSETMLQREALCDHLPRPGSFSMTVDLYDYALRTSPITLRLVRETEAGVEKIQSWPAHVYPTGNVAVLVKLDRPGQYALLLDASNVASSMTSDVRIPLHVGNGETSYFFVAGVALLLGGAVVWWKRQRQT